jgi:hypothetical protein
MVLRLRAYGTGVSIPVAQASFIDLQTAGNMTWGSSAFLLEPQR